MIFSLNYFLCLQLLDCWLLYFSNTILIAWRHAIWDLPSFSNHNNSEQSHIETNVKSYVPKYQKLWYWNKVNSNHSVHYWVNLFLLWVSALANCGGMESETSILISLLSTSRHPFGGIIYPVLCGEMLRKLTSQP